MTWFSLISLRESLCWKSLRMLGMRSSTLATSCLVLARRFEPCCLRDSFCYFRFKLRGCFLRGFGLSNLEPSDVIAKWVKPTSISTALA